MRYAIFNQRTQSLTKHTFQYNEAGKKKARNKVDKLDNDYGAYVHCIKIIDENGNILSASF